MASSSAQSDDCYCRICFTTGNGSEVDGTLGWREGAKIFFNHFYAQVRASGEFVI